MKKFMLVLSMVAFIGMTGCSSKTDSPESTKVPTTTPSSTQVAETTKAPNNKETESTMDETKVQQGIMIKGTSVQGTFVEDTEQYPTIITFNEEGTFESKVNICSAMIEITGEYKLEGDQISLTIPTETGIYYLDNDQPFEFTITENSLTNNSKNTLSCAETGSYSPE